jgi:hypothetical protein
MSLEAGMPAHEIAASVRAGRVRAVEVAEAALARVGAHNAWLGAFTDVTRERALREAAAIDDRVMRGEDPGPLAGVPYAVKNLFDIEGLATRAGSKINRDDPPAARDAVLIARLQGAGQEPVADLGIEVVGPRFKAIKRFKALRAVSGRGTTTHCSMSFRSSRAVPLILPVVPRSPRRRDGAC